MDRQVLANSVATDETAPDQGLHCWPLDTLLNGKTRLLNFLGWLQQFFRVSECYRLLQKFHDLPVSLWNNCGVAKPRQILSPLILCHP